MSRAWLVLALTFSYSSTLASRRSCACFCCATTSAAASASRRCSALDSRIACSSCTFGSARCSWTTRSFTPRYFHHCLIERHIPTTPLSVTVPAVPASHGDLPTDQAEHAENHDCRHEVDQVRH